MFTMKFLDMNISFFLKNMSKHHNKYCWYCAIHFHRSLEAFFNEQRIKHAKKKTSAELSEQQAIIKFCVDWGKTPTGTK